MSWGDFQGLEFEPQKTKECGQHVGECQECGLMFGDREQFCGRCGAEL